MTFIYEKAVREDTVNNKFFNSLFIIQL